jgi:arsenate reductase-like glutaredoxin family protein
MKIYILKNCDTCRRALREIREAGHETEICDVRADGVAAPDLERFHDAFGEALVNRRSATWRQLSEAEKAEEPVSLILRYPTLIKRPVIEHDGQLYLGWNGEIRAKILG